MVSNKTYLELLSHLPDCINPEEIEEGRSYTLVHHEILHNEWQLDYAEIEDFLSDDNIHYLEVEVVDVTHNYLYVLVKNLNQVKGLSMFTYGGLWGLRYSVEGRD